MRLTDHNVRVTPSIGIALYKETMNAGGLKRLTIETQLRVAVSRNELSLQYQPQFTLGTGLIAGFEALLRWTHAELGSVPPDDFIPVAEETGLIIAMGEWALRTACRQAKTWHEPRLLELEVTESMVMQDESRADRVCAALKDLGVSLAVDDFSTGYSNFRRLGQLKVDRLKIDRSFVGRIQDSAEDRALVSGMLRMAQTLGLAVVAEGVEDFSQLLHLQDERCEQARVSCWGDRSRPRTRTRC